MSRVFSGNLTQNSIGAGFVVNLSAETTELSPKPALTNLKLTLFVIPTLVEAL